MLQMTELQREILREAIGLNKSRKSLYNYYVSEATDELNAAVAAGWMVNHKRDPVLGGYGKKMNYYMVTATGASKVLQDGETLDQRDFPGVALQREFQL